MSRSGDDEPIVSEAVWQELLAQLQTHGDGWDGRPLRVRHGTFVVTLDRHAELAGYASQVTTRLRAAFVNPGGWRVQITRHTWLDRAWTALGAADLQIGDAAFDAAFRIRTNDDALTQQWLAEPGLRQALVQSPIASIVVRDDEGWFGPEFPDGVDELRVECDGAIDDRDVLTKLYQLFSRLLDRLLRCGGASSADPRVTL